MSEYARVLDVHEMAAFRALLVKVAEAVRNGVGGADAEMRDIKRWLEQEQPQVWARRIKKLQRTLDDAVETLRRKQLTPTPTGDPPNVMFEKKAVRVAKQRLEEAQERAARTKHWARAIDREEQLFRANTQGARNAVQGTVPQAIRTLDELLGHLEEYMKLAAAMPTPQSAEDEAGPSIARPDDAEPVVGDDEPPRDEEGSTP